MRAGSEKTYSRWSAWLTISTISLVGLATIFYASVGTVNGQEKTDMDARVDIAVKLYAKDPNAAFTSLTKLGRTVFPMLIKVISNDEYPGIPPSFKKSRINPFLLSVIEADPSRYAEQILVGLTKSSDVLMRGMSAKALGHRKSRRSIPCIVRLLMDGSPYMSYAHSDASGEEPSVLPDTTRIRDIAVDALTEITGINMMPTGSQDTRVRAWIGWARKRKLRITEN